MGVFAGYQCCLNTAYFYRQDAHRWTIQFFELQGYVLHATQCVGDLQANESSIAMHSDLSRLGLYQASFPPR